MANLKRTMFREYDIRGQTNEEELNKTSTELIAKGFGSMFVERGGKECIVGYDNRAYSKELMGAAVRGLLSVGVNVKNIGQVPAPLAYWSQYFLDIRGVCMGTASHNPNGWFGLKLGFDKTDTEVDFAALYERIVKEEFLSGQGVYEEIEQERIFQAYVEDLLGRAVLHRPMKIVVNSGNGVAGPIGVRVLRAFGCEVIEQNTIPDSRFPNHEPNPSSVGFQKVLEEKVKEAGADCGIGFDADGDRLGVVDNLGRNMNPDRALIFLARLELTKKPGAAIVFDAKATRSLIDDIKRNGGRPVMEKPGHMFIKTRARLVDAPVSGERSGHIFFRSGYYGFDDAIFAAMKFLEYVSSQNKTVAELHDEVTTYVTSPTYQAACADEIKYKIVDGLVEAMKEKYGERNVNTVSGARVEFADGWGLVRASSNLPKLVLVFEAKTKEQTEEIKKEFVLILKKYPEVGEIEKE